MSKITYNKLIRDRIPEIIAASGKTCSTIILDNESFFQELKNKLVEEANELLHAQSQKELLNELADLLEVIESIIHSCGFSHEQLHEIQSRKLTERGGFKQRLFLEYVEEPD